MRYEHMRKNQSDNGSCSSNLKPLFSPYSTVSLLNFIYKLDTTKILLKVIRLRNIDEGIEERLRKSRKINQILNEDPFGEIFATVNATIFATVNATQKTLFSRADLYL